MEHEAGGQVIAGGVVQCVVLCALPYMPRQRCPALLMFVMPDLASRRRPPAGRAGDSSGGQVVSEGEVGLAWPVNRETRLQAWAADMFQQLAMMRQDLRLARMEVVGAQEVRRFCRCRRRWWWWCVGGIKVEGGANRRRVCAPRA